MADLTPEQAIEKLRTLPEDKQRAVLGRLSPEARKGILASLSAPKTAGERYNAARASSTLPKKDVYTYRNPKEAVQQAGEDLATSAQAEQNKATPAMFRQGKYAGERPKLEQAGHALMSGVDEIGSVVAKAAGSMMDPATAVATAGLATPVTAPVSAAYFATQGVKGAYEGAKDIHEHGATPENVQDTLLSGATVAGAGGGGEFESPTRTIGDIRRSAAERFGKTARKITGVEPALKEAVTKASDAHAEDLTEHAATSENVAKRGELAKTIDTQSKELHGHISKVEQSVAKEANAKFDAVRAKIGNPEAPATELVSTVKNVEQNVLQNIPENIKEFRAIMQHEPLPEGIKNAAEAHGFDLEGTEPLTWEKLQSLKSRLDARLRKGRGMNGDLKRAIYQTRDAVVGEMGKMADANGASGEWGQARDFWRQYKEDFHEGTGPSGSGSPIAQALNAEDPKNIRQPFLRTQSAIGNRGVELLRKYHEHGGTEAADHVTKIISGHQELNDLPTRPKGFSETPPAGPTVDASKVARDAIAQRAKNWGSFNARDIGIIASGGLGELLGGLFGSSPFDRALGAATGVGMYEGAKYYTSRALNNPKVVEWLSRTPAEEVAVLNKIPGADKVKIVNTLTDAAVSGKATNLSPVARQLLGPANVAKILAATGAGVVQNRREARERLGQPSN